MAHLAKPAIESIQQGDRFFRWRGGEVSRLEALFDAVIALALTLIVVTVEVPSSFDELLIAFRKLPAFAICFAILLMCWYYNFLFHRRYGIEDFPVVIMNSILMFLVIFYVYPLKFLYFLMFDQASATIQREQVPTLMCMYSGGFVAIFALLLGMYVYAYTKRTGLGLSQNETTLTKMKLTEMSIYIGLGLGSIAIAISSLPVPIAGLIYILTGPLQAANGAYWGRHLHESE